MDKKVFLKIKTLEGETKSLLTGLTTMLGDHRKYPDEELLKCVSAISYFFDYTFDLLHKLNKKPLYSQTDKTRETMYIKTLENLSTAGVNVREVLNIVVTDPNPEEGNRSAYTLAKEDY